MVSCELNESIKNIRLMVNSMGVNGHLPNIDINNIHLLWGEQITTKPKLSAYVASRLLSRLEQMAGTKINTEATNYLFSLEFFFKEFHIDSNLDEYQIRYLQCSEKMYEMLLSSKVILSSVQKASMSKYIPLIWNLSGFNLFGVKTLNELLFILFGNDSPRKASFILENHHLIPIKFLNADSLEKSVFNILNQ